jgi:hypothetical protein
MRPWYITYCLAVAWRKQIRSLLRKKQRNPCHKSGQSSRDSKHVPSEYKSNVLSCTPKCFNHTLLLDDAVSIYHYRLSQEERSIFWEVTVSVILRKKKVYMYMCHVPNGFRDTTISPHNSKIVKNKRDITYCF